MIIRRESKFGSNDLNVVYRPCRVDEISGNETNKKLLKNALDTQSLPHTQLFIGDAGCGKTTAARIVALSLNCEKGVSSNPCLECGSCLSILNNNSLDVKEINVGQSGGKGSVDILVNDLSLAPFNSRYKILIFDEAHELTSAAKDLLLKPIENGFSHVYFIFCTNQPDKLKSKKKDKGQPFLDRCSVLNFNRINQEDMLSLLSNVCEYEGWPVKPEVLNVLINESKGVVRSALVWLSQVAVEGSWTPEVAAEICCGVIDTEEVKTIELCRAMVKGQFKNSISQYDELNKIIPTENIRITVTAYFVGCLKRARTARDARKISKCLDVLTVPIFEQGKLAEHKWYNYMWKVVDIMSERSK